MLGGPFEGSEGGENPERETESLEELRNRFRTKYPEAEQLSQDQSRTTEQHNLSQTTGWEDRERLDEQQFSDEKRLENELEILQKEIIEKYPSTEEPASKNGADSKIKNHIDGIGGEEAGEGDSSKQHLQEDPGVNSGERDRSYEEKLSQTKSKLEQDLPEEHKIEGGNTSEASDYRPRTDSVVPEFAHATLESHAKHSGDSPQPEEPSRTSATEKADTPRSSLDIPIDSEKLFDTSQGKHRNAREGMVVADQSSNSELAEAKEVRERQVIESTLQGERRGRPNFAIRKNIIEDVIGEKMEKGKEYEIRIRIDGIGDFKIRHVERGEDRIFISVPKEGRPENLRFGEKHRIEIYSVEERRDFNVIDTKEAGPMVKISRTSLESWGFQAGKTGPHEKRILDLEFRNISRPEQPTKRYFAAYDGKKEEMNLRLGMVGVRAGDVLRLEERKEYRMDDFLRDFDKHKVEAIRNARLLNRSEGLQIEVDGRNFPLKEPRLRAYGLRAVLSAKIQATDTPIKFTFDGEQVAAKLFDDAPITGLRSEYGLAIKYDQGENAARTFRLFDRFNAGVLSDRIRLVSSPETEQGVYIAEPNRWLGEHVRSRFSQIDGKERLAREKGDISEEIARCMLSMGSQWDEVADHPFAIRGEGSRRRGPDSLQRLRSSGELYYFEFKWWNIEIQELARFEAEHQALRDCVNHPTYKGENVVGVYIGLLEWDVHSKEIRLKVERVLLEDE